MRKDGIRVKNVDTVHGIMPFLMKNRCEAEVYYVETIDITKLLKYLDNINEGKEKHEKVTMFHAIITAVAKTIYNRPLLNRFISGQRYYDRKEVSFGFVAKNKLEDDAEERLIILNSENDMTLKDISEKILKIVSKTRKENSNDMNDILGVVTKLPRWLLNIVMGLVRWLDYHGILPSFLSDGDINFTTVMLSNLGSVKANCCYHHLNNYGTNSIIATVGVIREENNKKFVDIGFTLDERIADGIYFAKSIKLMRHILENPELLEDKIGTKIELEKKD
ncbi:MAG: 2-oxo acid dehydrogenase subunit E2 [Bacilli bacterium]|nr:2-oxo acid dehydrogenase subunit E2 [Bacilli bacterium]